jgi:DNA-directed RNA polymerase subunit K/omega
MSSEYFYTIKITKYEKARILGVRATQIANGSKPLINIEGMYDCFKIALKEFEQGKTPIDIIRTLPNGQKFQVIID